MAKKLVRSARSETSKRASTNNREATTAKTPLVLSVPEQIILDHIALHPLEIIRLRMKQESVVIQHVIGLLCDLQQDQANKEQSPDKEATIRLNKAVAAALIWAVTNIAGVSEEDRDKLKEISRNIDSFLRLELWNDVDGHR
jgi:hypothetical protein